MALFDQSKGGSSIADAFLKNKATQPAQQMQQLPQITQPVQQPFDFGSMAPRPQMPPAQAAGPKQNPLMVNGRLISSPGEARAVMINFPGKVNPQIDALARQSGALWNSTGRNSR